MSTKSFKRKLTAIFSAEVVDYSRLMGEDEDATIRILTNYRFVLPYVNMSKRGNIEINRYGDENVITFATMQNCSVVPLINQRGDYRPENFSIEFDTYFSEFCKKYDVSD